MPFQSLDLPMSIMILPLLKLDQPLLLMILPMSALDLPLSLLDLPFSLINLPESTFKLPDLTLKWTYSTEKMIDRTTNNRSDRSISAQISNHKSKGSPLPRPVFLPDLFHSDLARDGMEGRRPSRFPQEKSRLTLRKT